MAIQLKPLNEQVIVITGSSSGIGLATATEAARRGARVVLAARSIETLQQIVDRIKASGGEALAVACDVADREQIDRVAFQAIERFGGIDTWVNNAGVSIYGRLDEVSEADSRQLFETNFWGLYHGSLAALPHLKRRGGALINVGSEVSEAVVPLQGIYSASKHAVKGFTDALRVEIQEVDKAPVSITLIQPTAVNTPYPQHARNYMPQEPKLPPPMIEPEQVAEAILKAAETPTHHIKVGLMAKIDTLVANLAPSLADKLSAKRANQQQEQAPPEHPQGALYDPSDQTPTVGVTHGKAEPKKKPSPRKPGRHGR